MNLGFICSSLTVASRKKKFVVLGLRVKRSNNVLLCVPWLDRKNCRWNCATVTREPIHYWSSHQRCSIKKVLLQISQNPQENPCARSLLIKLQALRLQFYQKSDSGTGVFLWILRFLRTPFPQNISGRLLLRLNLFT